nr:hypothetical protein [Tanacetum cinerariifolium]
MGCYFDTFFTLRFPSQGSLDCGALNCGCDDCDGKYSVVMKNIAVEYFLDLRNFGSRIVGVDDTQAVFDKRVSFAFQTEDTVASKNLSFVTMGEDKTDEEWQANIVWQRSSDEAKICISPYRLLY